MDLRLNGKRAIVTGGSRGIGFAVAAALTAEGADVAIVARDAEALDRARARIGGNTLAVPADATDDSAVRAAVERTVAGFGGVDILVNAAAQPADPTKPATLADLDDDDLRAEIETKVLGYLRFARAAAPHMIAGGWGRIVNISGLNARRTGSPFGSIRNVSVAALTKNLADELGPHGITVTVVHPGLTVTERTPGMVEGVARSHGVSAAEAETLLGRGSAIGRMVTAEEVADVVTFLASPRSVAITGDAIAAGGGMPGPIFY
ncbi:SDR family NAD(P)-dependent oxidoreductase [Amycolatopsis thermophila]|uniref:NAD(P)-dependent dehydrogenase (Short-subunit alcohol dehydrogenase family) n=1 Tax=Amycolatopsis thermophila TaxID=206084 RepID=A0ABU0F3X1_9PSEU|nr:SDR family oxidoreductase [Amycolatopsis thermophila]MDQ0382073.1 NAD(P)-dependent dehydrogenase (short-subunit alcohol dehydrogenase family) [Amycolatopsis thermophila]